MDRRKKFAIHSVCSSVKQITCEESFIGYFVCGIVGAFPIEVGVDKLQHLLLK